MNCLYNCLKIYTAAAYQNMSFMIFKNVHLVFNIYYLLSGSEGLLTRFFQKQNKCRPSRRGETNVSWKC